MPKADEALSTVQLVADSSSQPASMDSEPAVVRFVMRKTWSHVVVDPETGRDAITTVALSAELTPPTAQEFVPFSVSGFAGAVPFAVYVWAAVAPAPV